MGLHSSMPGFTQCLGAWAYKVGIHSSMPRFTQFPNPREWAYTVLRSLGLHKLGLHSSVPRFTQFLESMGLHSAQVLGLTHVKLHIAKVYKGLTQWAYIALCQGLQRFLRAWACTVLGCLGLHTYSLGLHRAYTVGLHSSMPKFTQCW